MVSLCVGIRWEGYHDTGELYPEGHGKDGGSWEAADKKGAREHPEHEGS